MSGLSMVALAEATFHFHVLLPFDVTLHKLMEIPLLRLNWSFGEETLHQTHTWA